MRVPSAGAALSNPRSTFRHLWAAAGPPGSKAVSGGTMERFAGRYALIRPLGLGGMGAVHLALDLATGRECALKRLEPGVLFGTPDSLRQEFDVLSRLRHPAVV